MNVIDAFNSVQARVLEHTHEGKGAGLTLVLEQLGVDPDDMEAAIPSVLYEHDINRIPVSAGLVAAFAAGATYTRANHSSAPEKLSLPQIERGALALYHTEFPEGNWETLHTMRQENYRRTASIVLSAIDGGPAAGPPTGDEAREP